MPDKWHLTAGKMMLLPHCNSSKALPPPFRPLLLGTRMAVPRSSVEVRRTARRYRHPTSRMRSEAGRQACGWSPTDDTYSEQPRDVVCTSRRCRHIVTRYSVFLTAHKPRVGPRAPGGPT